MFFISMFIARLLALRILSTSPDDSLSDLTAVLIGGRKLSWFVGAYERLDYISIFKTGWITLESVLSLPLIIVLGLFLLWLSGITNDVFVFTW